MTFAWTDLPAFAPTACSFASVFLPADVPRLQPGLSLVLLRSAYDAMAAGCSDTTVESVGLLRGRVLVDGSACVTLVEVAEPLPDAERLATSVRTTAATWAGAWPSLHARGEVVGWFHSHPGFGIFFSATDRATQRDHFAQAWQVGLVFDPHNGELGAFAGAGSAVVPWLIVEALAD